jgi:hypothetical protein
VALARRVHVVLVARSPGAIRSSPPTGLAVTEVWNGRRSPAARISPVLRSVLMNLSWNAAGSIRRSWSLTQTDVVLCSLPIVFFLSIVSFV